MAFRCVFSLKVFTSFFILLGFLDGCNTTKYVVLMVKWLVICFIYKILVQTLNQGLVVGKVCVENSKALGHYDRKSNGAFVEVKIESCAKVL